MLSKRFRKRSIHESDTPTSPSTTKFSSPMYNDDDDGVDIYYGDIKSLHTKASPSAARTASSCDGPPPWEAWKLDRTFFESYSLYCFNHPKFTLEATLERIFYELENGGDILGVIPERSFPARGFFIALGWFVRLGVTVKRTKISVREFATQVISWVNIVKSVFESDDPDFHFTWTTWQHMRRMRDLIDEICSWSHSRVVDDRWCQIGNGLMVAKEIDEFKVIIGEAKELFTDLALINLSGGIIAIKEAIKVCLYRQSAVTLKIRKIKRQQRKQVSYLVDRQEAKKQAATRRAYLVETLNRRVVVNPTYDEQGKSPCDEGTRIAELAAIATWLKSITPGSQNFLWLTGDPGCGKSAITASLARQCKEHGVLWAQFFINRNNKETTDPNSYFPSIARQLANRSPEVECVLYDRLKAKPSLIDYISPDQAAKLFVDALGVVAKLNSRKVVAVIIDGLDETDRGRLSDTAIIFARLFEELTEYPNVKVFISSRTEDDIRNPFARNMKDGNVKHVHLDTAASITDVSSFLRRKVACIVERNDLNWEVWPTEARMNLFAVRAGGLFIWAVTAAKFLQDQIDEHGTECLEEVINALTEEPLEGINALYGLILRRTHEMNSTDWDYEKFRRILGAIIVLREPLSLQDLSELLDIRQTPSSPRVDIFKFTRRLCTLLVASADAIDSQTKPHLHKSFFEFITSPEVFASKDSLFDPRLRIDPDMAEVELALRCLQHFGVLYDGIQQRAGNYELLPTYILYSFRFWRSHLHHSGSTKPGIIARGWGSGLAEIQACLSQSSIGSGGGPLLLSFSPDRSKFSTSFGTSRYQWNASTGKEIPSILRSHKDYVRCIAFSPNGKQLVSGSKDRSLILWDLQTCSQLGSLVDHSDEVWAVAFSPFGDRLASGSKDCTVRLWDSENLQLLAVLEGHQDIVKSVVFFPDGKLIASGSADNTIRVWDVQSAMLMGEPFDGHTAPVECIALTPDGQQMISGSKDRTLRLWDAKTGKPLGKPARISGNRIFSVCFCQSGRYVAAATSDGIEFWTHQGKSLKSNAWSIPTVGDALHAVFIPDGKSLAFSQSHSPRFNFCDVKSGHLMPFSANGTAHSPAGKFTLSSNGAQVAWVEGSRIHVLNLYLTPRGRTPAPFTACSLDGSLVVTADGHDRVRLWDSRITPIASKRLDGNCRLECAAFSSNNALFAGVGDASLYIWEVSSRRLVASGWLEGQHPVVSISFSADFRTVVTRHADAQTINAWHIDHGTLTLGKEAPNAVLYSSVFWGVDKKLQKVGASAEWFPANDEEFGVWAYLDDHIIVGKRDGSVMIIPVRRPSQRTVQT